MKRLFDLYPATSILLAINVIVFVIIFAGELELFPFQREWVTGFPRAFEFPPDGYGNLWDFNLLVSSWSHFSLSHLVMNLLACGILGSYLERIVGFDRFWVVILFIWLLESFIFWGIGQYPAIGFSGITFGILGFLVLQTWGLKIGKELFVPYLGIGIIFSFWGNTSWEGHLAGLIAGFLSYGFLYFWKKK